jgi:hypothetical protein
MPALPLDEAGKYVAGAYLVFISLLLVYVAIMSARLARLDRELAELGELAEANEPLGPGPGGADAGADQDARGEAQGKVFERERSTRQEVLDG